jgi:hypothetical protein
MNKLALTLPVLYVNEDNNRKNILLNAFIAAAQHHDNGWGDKNVRKARAG